MRSWTRRSARAPREALRDQVVGTQRHVLGLVNEMKAHVPPVTTSDVVSFPFEISVPLARDDSPGSFGRDMLKTLGVARRDAALDDLSRSFDATSARRVAARATFADRDRILRELFHFDRFAARASTARRARRIFHPRVRVPRPPPRRSADSSPRCARRHPRQQSRPRRARPARALHRKPRRELERVVSSRPRAPSRTPSRRPPPSRAATPRAAHRRRVARARGAHRRARPDARARDGVRRRASRASGASARAPRASSRAPVAAARPTFAAPATACVGATACRPAPCGARAPRPRARRRRASDSGRGARDAVERARGRSRAPTSGRPSRAAWCGTRGVARRRARRWTRGSRRAR